MHALSYYLEDLPYPTLLYSTSSLDAYFGLAEGSALSVYTEADLIELAKIYSALEYPGEEHVDAVLTLPEGKIFFRTVDSIDKPPVGHYSITNFFYDPGRRVFKDPYGVYGDVRKRVLRFHGDDEVISGDAWRLITEAAILRARYEPTDDEVSEELIDAMRSGSKRARERIGKQRHEKQKDLLIELFSAKNPKVGFELLRKTGYVDQHWPELASMYGVHHTKDHHPEGNVWEHTLETFRYRKDRNLTLSLGLLFHDAGKPYSRPNEGRMFDGHAQIGARMALKFLTRLGFEDSLIRDVSFLVREHMLPAFIPKLPMYRTERVMSSDLFPMLLELYRCDLSSTYRGPDGYYRACKVYRAYLKNVRNPFRTSDGKKLLRRYVER